MNVTPVGQGTGLQAAVRRLARNLATNTVLWCRALVRPVPSISIGRSPGTIVWSVILIVAAIAAMFLLDMAALDWARREPHWVRAAVEKVTDLGLAGCVLVP